MRHKIKIFASEISSLTDARYFSAIGANWLGHFPQKTGLTDMEFNAIKPWVTGPEWVFESTTMQGAEESMKQLGIALLKVGEEEPATHADFVERSLQGWLDMDLDIEIHAIHWIVHLKEMPSEFDIVRLKRSAGMHNVLIKAPALGIDHLLHLLQKVQPRGLVLCGSKEEKTGIKSYDFINDLIDAMDSHQWI